jgi:hypothetical protein
MLNRPNIHPDSIFLLPLKVSNAHTFVPKDALESFEMKCEARFIETLDRINMVAKLKSDRYSLPTNKRLR